MDVTLRHCGLALATLIMFIAGSVSHAQSLDPQQPAALGAGVNKGNVDSMSGDHYYYFWAGPGHIDVKMGFKEMGIFGAPLRQALNFDFFDESGKLLSHNAVVSLANVERITTSGDLSSRQKVILAVTPQKGLVRLGGYYEIEVTGAVAFDGPASATAGVTPKGTELVHPGGPLLQPGGVLVQPGGALSKRGQASAADPPQPPEGTAKLIAEGTTVRGSLVPGQDRHFFQFQASSTKTRVILRKRSKSGFQAAVDVYDHNEKGVAEEHEGVSLLPGIYPQNQPITLSFESHPGELYSIVVTALGSNARGNYELTVRKE
jgi:hypothetical protein